MYFSILFSDVIRSISNKVLHVTPGLQNLHQPEQKHFHQHSVSLIHPKSSGLGSRCLCTTFLPNS